MPNYVAFEIKAGRSLVKTAKESANTAKAKIRVAGIYAVAHAIRYGNCALMNDVAAISNDALAAVNNLVRQINETPVEVNTVEGGESPAAIFTRNKADGYRVRKDNARARSMFVPGEGVEMSEDDAQAVVDRFGLLWDNVPEKAEKEATEKPAFQIAVHSLQRLVATMGKADANNAQAKMVYDDLKPLIAKYGDALANLAK